MPTEFAHACRNLIGGETFKKAAAEVEAGMARRVLNAKTPEERIRKGEEYDGFNRLVTFLHSKAAEAEKDDR